MLEVVIAGAMLAGVMTSLSIVMRTARQSWEMNDNESASLHQMHAVTRHFVRTAREARSVTAINSNSIALEMRDGSTNQWTWKSTADGLSNTVTVTSSTDNVESILAHDIQSIRFTGYDADGVSVTTNPQDTHVIAIRTTVELADVASPNHHVESKVWIRSW